MRRRPSRSLVSFTDLRSAAYCARKCYYDRRRDDRSPPPTVSAIRSLAHRYETLLDPEESLAEEPIEPAPAVYRDTLAATRARLRRRGRWEAICDPIARDVLATGRDCRGVVHKVLDEPLEPSLVSPGRPPERGVWEPQAVGAVAAAKAIARERERPVEAAWIEYPAYGAIRRVTLTTRRKARYRRALRTVREIDGPPPRTRNRRKCRTCDYAETCGVRTRTLKSLLGLD